MRISQVSPISYAGIMIDTYYTQNYSSIIGAGLFSNLSFSEVTLVSIFAIYS